MAANTANILSVNTATTNITSSAYVEISASSPIPTAAFMIVNKTTSVIKIALGASGSEVDLAAIGPSSQFLLPLGFLLKAGSRIAVEALDATASSGYFAIGLMP